jgi:hypothetical protein
MINKNMMTFKKFFVATTAILFVFGSCKKEDTVSASTTTTISLGTNVPDVYKKIYGASSITSDGTYLTIKTNGLPDHKSVYYATTNTLYETFSGTTFNGLTFSKNPNTIATQSFTFKIPLNPAVAATHATTPMGPIGVSLNGVPFYNQYAAMNSPLTNEANGFDKYYGHPQMSGQYHYHVEPLYLTTVKASKSALLGFLLDGFPVYGPEENGVTITNSNLDVYHGHTSATADYPNGIYHYHITTADPYINGSGFYGTAGTVTQ